MKTSLNFKLCRFLLITGVRQNSQPTKSQGSSSSISTKDMQLIVDKLKSDHLRSSTKRNYYSVWKSFNSFYLRLDEKPSQWEDRLTLFVAFMVEKETKSTTIKSYISAIKAVLKDIDIDLQEDRYLLSSLTRACKLNNDVIRTWFPIQRNLFGMLVQKCYSTLCEVQQVYLANMYRALFTAAYFGMLRIGEVTSGNHPIKAIDVHIGQNKKNLLFVLRTSKTHTLGDKPQLIKITVRENTQLQNRSTDEYLCPFTIIRKFIAMRPSCRQAVTEPFFIFRDRSPVKPVHA